MGDKYLLGDSHTPWILNNSQFESYEDGKLYVFAYYWTFEVMTTVGYGDFAGSTTIECLITLFLEFSGLLVFSLLSLFYVRIQDGTFDYDQFIGNKFDQLDVWTANIES